MFWFLWALVGRGPLVLRVSLAICVLPFLLFLDFCILLLGSRSFRYAFIFVCGFCAGASTANFFADLDDLNEDAFDHFLAPMSYPFQVSTCCFGYDNVTFTQRCAGKAALTMKAWGLSCLASAKVLYTYSSRG